jgi:biopolymer transport protein ExbD
MPRRNKVANSTLGGAVQGRRSRLITDINVIPLVDITLVLLIIFMVTATALVQDTLEVKLPEAATGQKTEIVLVPVVIDANEKLFLSGKPTDEAGIREYIRAEHKKNSKMEALIAADRRVPHGTVVRIIDLVRSEGVIKFAINVLKPKPE